MVNMIAYSATSWARSSNHSCESHVGVGISPAKYRGTLLLNLCFCIPWHEPLLRKLWNGSRVVWCEEYNRAEKGKAHQEIRMR